MSYIRHITEKIYLDTGPTNNDPSSPGKVPSFVGIGSCIPVNPTDESSLNNTGSAALPGSLSIKMSCPGVDTTLAAESKLDIIEPCSS